MNNIYKKRKIIGLTLVFGLFLVVSGCFHSEKTSPDIITQPVEISDSTKNSNDSMVDNDDIGGQDIVEDVDTSDWLTYRNEELGIEFKYPKRYKKYIEYVIKFDKNDPINKGQSLSLYSKNGPIKFNFYSKNYISFGRNGLEYRGNKNLSNSCKNNLQISNNYESVIFTNSVGFCKNIKIDNQDTFYDTKLAYLPECGGLSISQSVYLNLNNLKYSGLVIFAELPHNNLDNLYDCTSDTTRLEQQTRQYFQKIIDKKQLDKNTKIEIDEFYKLLSTFKLINK